MLLGPVRVSWIQVEMEGDHPVCHLVGTSHHRPLRRRLPLAAATSLMARGVPAVVRRPQPPALTGPGAHKG